MNAIGAHHDEMEMQYVISPIIQACDAISGARPGAKAWIMQQYIQRIKDLENLALAYTGVEKAYAIQAGRELRVIVEADKVTDNDSDKLSFEIAQKIQTEMTFPGQIKVTVIRGKKGREHSQVKGLLIIIYNASAKTWGILFTPKNSITSNKNQNFWTDNFKLLNFSPTFCRPLKLKTWAQ